MPPNQSPSHRRLLIAVDGPAASGKGTLAKRLAAHFGLGYLDTGSLYRAVGRKALMRKRAREGENTLLTADDDTADAALAIEAAQGLQPEDWAHGDLGEEWVGHAASIVSAIPQVRAALLDYQRQFAANPQGAVLDGRDIGTVICPEAPVKLYITASPQVRAERRFKQQAAPAGVSYEAILDAICERDARDEGRAAAPLKPAADAVIIDTSAMDAETVFQAALGVVGR